MVVVVVFMMVVVGVVVVVVVAAAAVSSNFNFITLNARISNISVDIYASCFQATSLLLISI
jgi:hypothetical protein